MTEQIKQRTGFCYVYYVLCLNVSLDDRNLRIQNR